MRKVAKLIHEQTVLFEIQMFPMKQSQINMNIDSLMISTKRGFVGARGSYKDHAAAYTNHTFMTGGSAGVITPNTMVRKCDANTSSGEGRDATFQ